MASALRAACGPEVLTRGLRLQPGELLEQMPGFLRQLLGDDNVDRDQHVAGPVAVCAASLTAEPAGLARLRPAGSLQLAAPAAGRGALTSAPRAASGYVIGSVSVRSRPLRPKIWCG